MPHSGFDCTSNVTDCLRCFILGNSITFGKPPGIGGTRLGEGTLPCVTYTGTGRWTPDMVFGLS